MSFRKGRIAAVGAGAVLVLAGVAGCGSSDDSSSDSSGSSGSSGTELTKEEFVTQANQICADASAESKKTEPEFTAAVQKGDNAAAADALQKNQDASRASIDELEALVPPAADQAKIEAMTTLMDKQSELVPELIDAVRQGDSATISKVGKEGDALNKQIHAMADDYGLTECGSKNEA